MSPQFSILIVEDEKNLGTTLCDYLNSLDYKTYLATDGTAAKNLFHTHRPTIILMDIGLPDTDGITLAKEFRQQRKDFVLLFLSALNDPETKVQGLEIGAEDYITKPFALKELILRLERILKSQQFLAKQPECISHGPLKIWFQKFEVETALGDKLPLSQKECAILELLYTNKGQAIERERIIKEIWGENKFPSNRTVDNYIVKLRKWCESDTNKHIDILSIRGVGYKLIAKD